MRKKIIIFGGHGFVGSKIAEKLNEKHNVFTASRRNGYDINKISKIKSLINSFKPDYIIHCAVAHGGLSYINSYPSNIFIENSFLYFNLYKAIAQAKIKKNFFVINLISNCAYSHDVDIQKEDEWLNSEPHESVLPFAIPKRIAFYLSKFYENEFNIKSKNFLVPNAYGPGDYLDPQRTHALNGIIIRFIESIRKGKKDFDIWGSGKPKREWIYVDDIAKLISKEITYNKIESHMPINLAQNKSYSVLKITKLVKAILKSDIKLKTDPSKMDGAMMKQLSNKQFSKLYGTFKFENLETGIKKTIKYYNSKL